MNETFTDTGDGWLRCDICKFDLPARFKNEHRHIALMPVKTAYLASCIVWQNSSLMLCKVVDGYAKKIAADLNYMARNDFSLGGLVIDKMNSVYLLCEKKSVCTSWVVGYIALSCAPWRPYLPQTRQMFLVPMFRYRGYGRFLLLKALQHYSNNKRFTVHQPYGTYDMLMSMCKVGYLRQSKTINFEILKKPTTRLIRAPRAER